MSRQRCTACVAATCFHSSRRVVLAWRAPLTSCTTLCPHAPPSLLMRRPLCCLQGIAKTGSGKTAAFVLPMLVHIMDQPELQVTAGVLLAFQACVSPAAVNVAKGRCISVASSSCKRGSDGSSLMLPLDCSQPEPCCAVRTLMRLTQLVAERPGTHRCHCGRAMVVGSVFDSPCPSLPLLRCCRRVRGPLLSLWRPPASWLSRFTRKHVSAPGRVVG